MTFIFSPATQSDLVIAELPFEDTLAQITNEDNYVDIVIVGKTYPVNMGVSRLRIIKKSPVCACCGIRATACSLDLDVQSTKEAGELRYHINFYAATGVKDHNHQHMILFTRDHIVPKFKGGDETEENSQTLCFNCNCLKDSTEMDLAHMRKALFPAYRAYRSSKTLNLAKDRLHMHYIRLEKAKRAVENITQAIAIVTDHRAEGLKDKRKKAENTAANLLFYIRQVELQSQLTGVVPKVLCATQFGSPYHIYEHVN